MATIYPVDHSVLVTSALVAKITPHSIAIPYCTRVILELQRIQCFGARLVIGAILAEVEVMER